MNAETSNQGGARERTGLLATRPALYIALILCVVLATYGYKLRTEGIFSCPAQGYTSDWYLALCNAKGYGDYEHGAFLFDLEPEAMQFAGSADVLFLGSSRIQIALSSKATADWFSSIAKTYYLLGFGDTANIVFMQEILPKIKPRARVYIVNIERFFEQADTRTAAAVMRDPAAQERYEVKRAWQFFHQQICHVFAAICSDNYVIFRSRETGAYRWAGAWRIASHSRAAKVSYDRTVDHAAIQNEIKSGKEFLSRLPVKRECIILTIVPNVDTKIEAAKAMATALSMNLIAPELDGLLTFDGSHLDRPGAEQWSKAFLQAAAPQIRKCLE